MLILTIGLNGATEAEFGLTDSYLYNVNVFVFSIYFINRHFCAKTRILCHMI